MHRLSNFQLYCTLVNYSVPLAFLIIPGMVSHLLLQNAWLAIFAALIPGYLMVFMFTHILKKSSRPFPLLLEEHLGKYAGRIIALLYIIVFIFLSSLSLRLFTDFIETNVLPGTPISIHIGVALLAIVISLRSGIENVVRVNELIFLVGLPFALLMVFLVGGQQFNLQNLLPLGNTSLPAFFLALWTGAFAIGKLFIVLTFGFWSEDKQKAGAIMAKALWTYVLVIGLTTMAAILAFGGHTTSILTFPTFTMVTLINIGGFIQNIDIIFIGIWILGIYAVIIFSWFMALYIIQSLLNLKDYRFMAAPSALIIGIVSILIARNILELLVMAQYLLPAVETIAFILIPALLFIITLFKPVPASGETPSRT